MRSSPRIGGDQGSLIPMILLAFVVGGSLLIGGIVGGSVFLSQRNLQSVCDGAAVAGAQRLDSATFYRRGLDSQPALPLRDVQQAVDLYTLQEGATGPHPVRASAWVTDDQVTVSVRCEQTSHPVFGAVLGFGSGLDQHATAHARSPTATD